MKRARRLLGLLLLLGLCALTPASALAEEDEYTYTVRIYAGNQGTYQGQSVVEIPGCYPHQQITFNLRDVQLDNNSKYYVRGIRESGKDDAVQSAFTVEGDTDYVIVYGVLSNMTSYVINYVDTAGNILMPQETYYGNIGDKPVIAYLYIEGYQPQAYNLAKTLSENAAENVFTFIYTAEEQPETTEASPAGETSAAGDAGSAGAPQTSEAAAVETSAETQTAGEGESETAQDEVSIDDEQLPLGTQDFLDLDEIEDDKLPLADRKENGGFLAAVAGEARLLGVPLGIVAVAGAVLLGSVLWLILLVLRKRKKKEEKELEA